MIELICRKCGRKIKGITLNYSKSNKWECSNCNKKEFLCCESGCKVVAFELNNGYKGDSELAKRYLKENQIYTVESLFIDRSSSRLVLKEFPDIEFNTVHFKRYD